MKTPPLPPVDRPTSTSPTNSFAALIRKERAWLDGRTKPSDSAAPDDFIVSQPGLAQEPWLCFTSRDTFGVALSGGGIRSATFNLGLLQGLAEKDLLPRVDYISTVSGGGYAGGFLNAWQHNHPDSVHAFPRRHEPANNCDGCPTDTREPPALRQLREFSRFLMPRLGIAHIETWSAIVTILGGLLPSLFAACAVLATFVYLWVRLAHSLNYHPPYAGAAMMGALTLAILLGTERWRRRIRHSRDGGEPAVQYTAVITALCVALLWVIVGYKNRLPDGALDWLRPRAPGLAAGPVVPTAWLDRAFAWFETNFDLWSSDWPFLAMRDANIGGAFAPALAWFTVVVVLLLVRAISSRFSTLRQDWSSTVDRVIATCLGLGLAWSALAGVWAICQWLQETRFTGWSAAGIGAGAAASGGLFAWLRDWLKKPAEETRASTLVQRILGFLRPKIPQLLAAVAVLLLFAAICLIVQIGIVRGIYNGGLATALGIILFTLVFFDPARVGMHDFYRARISRCFLGAARADLAPYDRDTVERPHDDLTLGELLAKRRETSGHRPLHLVCCTANDLSGDVLGSLYRGGRSAVISPHGIALGDHAAPLDHLRLSSALTASAAAFNSQMGRFSVELGPAVAFVMSALNLRLGLWVPHPLNPNRKASLLPGLPFFYEMFGLTNCGIALVPEEPATTPPPGALPPTAGAAAKAWQKLAVPVGQHLHQARHAFDQTCESVRRRFCDLHLSDGGHFENLALYELVRRHCRYIVVSDCGADPDVAFDDLAIALRTIREDFGVEIDLDVSPLRHDEHGRSRQHAVIGTIHYDGLKGLDKGTLLYFKPTLTGDEPPDVLQYQTRNPAFPHESTGDQFYDEAQWESYRRLGYHAGSVVFHFVDGYSRSRRSRPSFVENVFLDASRQWHPAPERQGETFLALTERCAQLESELRDNAPAALRAEFFPEVAALCGPPAAARGNTATRSEADAASDELRIVFFLLQVAQVMEDVWVGAKLDTYWSHPMNDGWMNYCHRWAATPSFRRWWPLLRPIYSNGFRDFVRERFELGYQDADTSRTTGPTFKLEESVSQTGVVWDHLRRLGRPLDLAASGRKALEFRLRLDAQAALPGMRDLQVGVLLYRDKPGAVEWRSEDLYVPPSLNGAGITTRFLTSVIAHFTGMEKRAGIDRLEVVFDREQVRPDLASRLRQLQDVNFYKSRGFVSPQPRDEQGNLRLVLAKAALKTSGRDESADGPPPPDEAPSGARNPIEGLPPAKQSEVLTHMVGQAAAQTPTPPARSAPAPRDEK